MRRIILFFILCILMSTPLTGKADDIGQLTVVGPSWDRFANRDGTGLYNEILDRIFTDNGVQVRRLYVPSQRANELVQAGRADMMACRNRAVSPLFLARYPMYEGAYHVFFNTKRQPAWKGPQTFSGKSVVFRLGYYSDKDFAVPVIIKEVKTAHAALGMVLLGRADYYVDHLNFINEAIRTSPIPFDGAEYDIHEAGWRQYFPVLLDTPRGRSIEALYAAGMEQLHKSGELQRIFAKWGFEYPHYQFPE